MDFKEKGADRKCRLNRSLTLDPTPWIEDQNLAQHFFNPTRKWTLFLAIFQLHYSLLYIIPYYIYYSMWNSISHLKLVNA